MLVGLPLDRKSIVGGVIQFRNFLIEEPHPMAWNYGHWALASFNGSVYEQVATFSLQMAAAGVSKLVEMWTARNY